MEIYVQLPKVLQNIVDSDLRDLDIIDHKLYFKEILKEILCNIICCVCSTNNIKYYNKIWEFYFCEKCYIIETDFNDCIICNDNDIIKSYRKYRLINI